MAIYGIGAYFDQDISQKFIDNNIIGCGWNIKVAPELHQYIGSLKVGDIVYIKSASASSKFIFVKAIGIIIDGTTLKNDIVQCGRNVLWLNKDKHKILKPKEKNNVRSNTLYEEFHPEVQRQIIELLK